MSYEKHRYVAQRAFFLSVLGGRCSKCRSKNDLQIDHIDPSLKTMEMCVLFSRARIVAAVVELTTKCQILCESCHLKKSGLEFAARKGPIHHGTMYAWMKLKCKCEACSKAKWAWYDARNSKRRGTSRGPYMRCRQAGTAVPDSAPRPSRIASAT